MDNSKMASLFIELSRVLDFASIDLAQINTDDHTRTSEVLGSLAAGFSMRGLAIAGLEWKEHRPDVSGEYKYRPKNGQGLERFCTVTVYSDQSYEIHTEDGDTLDGPSNYEFAGPIIHSSPK